MSCACADLEMTRPETSSVDRHQIKIQIALACMQGFLCRHGEREAVMLDATSDKTDKTHLISGCVA